MARRKPGLDTGSGNVFADIGVREPEEMLVKAQLAAEIVRIIQSRKLTQTAAAKALDIDQPKVSALFRGRLRELSIERLVRFLTALHRDVRIVVVERPRRRRGRLIVDAA